MALRAMKDILTGNPRVIERWLTYAEKVERLQANLGEQRIDLTSLTEEQLRVLASLKIDEHKGRKQTRHPTTPIASGRLLAFTTLTAASGSGKDGPVSGKELRSGHLSRLLA